MFDTIPHKKVASLSSITEHEFTNGFVKANKPVIINELTSDWPARKNWDVQYLIKIAGENTVPVYSSKPATGKQHQHAASAQLKFKDYLNMLENGENDLRMFFYNILKNAPSLNKDFSYPKLGIKFFKRLPVLFIGGKGAKVQMHYDVDLANLLLCHFGGKKKVLLIPPDQSRYIYKVPFSFSALHDVDFSDPDINKYPAIQKLNGYVADLEHGDALFIPSGFWHYIVYEDIGFSLTLRSMPTSWKSRLNLIKNIFITRTIEGMMRKIIGQKWNDRNEMLAVKRTHENLAQSNKLFKHAQDSAQ